MMEKNSSLGSFTVSMVKNSQYPAVVLEKCALFTEHVCLITIITCALELWAPCDW